MQSAKSVDDYLAGSGRWQSALGKLRAVLLQTELDEEVKWGVPVYCLKGKNVVGLAGFKQYFGLWFYQGVFLQDQQQCLTNAQDGKTKALRQWRFSSEEEIDIELVRQYVDEAIANQKAGKEMKAEKNKPLEIPPLLAEVLADSDLIREQFEALSLSRQREYCEHVSSAKRDATKISRLEKIKPMIEKGIGLNDKYR